MNQTPFQPNSPQPHTDVTETQLLVIGAGPYGLATAAAARSVGGVGPFTRLPTWVERTLPPERYSHTSELARLERFAGARVLIVGGRQSAFETAALLAESGAERVDVVHRHDPPRFTTADWGFVEPLMEASVRWPGWFGRLARAHREAIERRF